MNVLNSKPQIQEILTQLPIFLTEYLKAEIEGEKRRQLGDINCDDYEEYGFTECCVATTRLNSDKQNDFANDLITYNKGYNVPKNVRIPVKVEWIVNNEYNETSICVKAYHDKIEINGDDNE